MPQFPPLAAFPSLALHESVSRDDVDAPSIVNKWLSQLSQFCVQGHLDDLSTLFVEESWWRDLLGLSWDFASKHGPESIGKYISSSQAEFGHIKAVEQGALQAQLVDMGPLTLIQSGFTFKTKFGYGRGVVKLANVSPQEWKAWCVFTRLDRLATQDEPGIQKAPESQIHKNRPGRVNVDSKSKKEPLQVLIIGAGQSGLAVAAHLQHLGIRYLVVDRVSRLGQSWRSRYDTLKTHTAVHADHMPFLRYPSDWPVCRERDLVADWMEHYAQSLKLNVALNTTVGKVEYDQSTQGYSVEIESEGRTDFLTTTHIVLATGSFSRIPVRPRFPGEDSFTGKVYHTSQHKSASQIPDLSNKKVAIIGCGTSAHDVAQDFVDRGAAAVSMIQRHKIFAFSEDSAEKFYFSIWSTPGVSEEDADMISLSFPTAVVRTLGLGMSQMMWENDKEIVEGLVKAGMILGKGDDGTSFIDHLVIRQGSFYVDQGAWPMIVDGKIKIHACEQGIKEFNSHGLILANDTQIEADVIVLATGFKDNILTVEEIMGKSVVEKVGDIGELDVEQERTGYYRPTGVPGLWYMTGSFTECRQFSALLALQISAVEQGLNDKYFDK